MHFIGTTRNLLLPSYRDCLPRPSKILGLSRGVTLSIALLRSGRSPRGAHDNFSSSSLTNKGDAGH